MLLCRLRQVRLPLLRHSQPPGPCDGSCALHPTLGLASRCFARGREPGAPTKPATADAPGKSGAPGTGHTEQASEITPDNVKKEAEKIQKRSQEIDFGPKWRNDPGHEVPYRFRIQDPQDKQTTGVPYTNYTGLRFPTLESAENFDYHKDRGLQRIEERSYPIKVPGYRRLDPYLREYIHFLHDLDPARFTVARIAERYRLRTKTVRRVVQEWGVNRYITRSGLTRLRDKQVTREAVILQKKEEQYAKWVGWDQLGDEDDPETDDEAVGEYRGWRATNDWVRRQNVEVESMSAFPMMEKRDPMPKRVDVDLVVDSRQSHKIINWIDPTDKVVF